MCFINVLGIPGSPYVWNCKKWMRINKFCLLLRRNKTKKQPFSHSSMRRTVKLKSFTDWKCVLFALMTDSCAELSEACPPGRSESHCRKGLYLTAISTLSPPLSTAYRCMAQVCVHACCLLDGWVDKWVIHYWMEHSMHVFFLSSTLKHDLWDMFSTCLSVCLFGCLPGCLSIGISSTQFPGLH